MFDGHAPKYSSLRSGVMNLQKNHRLVHQNCKGTMVPTIHNTTTIFITSQLSTVWIITLTCKIYSFSNQLGRIRNYIWFTAKPQIYDQETIEVSDTQLDVW